MNRTFARRITVALATAAALATLTTAALAEPQPAPAPAPQQIAGRQASGVGVPKRGLEPTGAAGTVQLAGRQVGGGAGVPKRGLEPTGAAGTVQLAARAAGAGGTPKRSADESAEQKVGGHRDIIAAGKSALPKGA